jgi:hypothetical protein
MTRLIRPIDPAKLTQDEIVHYTGRTELAWNEELWAAHYGEDGPGLDLQITREMFIGDQLQVPDLQEWAMFEFYDYC